MTPDEYCASIQMTRVTNRRFDDCTSPPRTEVSDDCSDDENSD